MRIRVLSAVAVSCLVAAGCGGSSGPSGSSIATVEVSPSTASRQVGQTIQLSVALKNSSGDLVSGQAVTWESSNEAVATVTTAGLVTTVSIGNATITARAGGKSGTAQITVTGVPVSSVVVTPETGSLEVGQTLQLNVEVRDEGGAVIPQPTVTWTSSNTGAATVSQQGLVTAVADGTTNIAATSGGRSDFATVTVSGPCSLSRMGPITVGEVVNGTLATGDCVLNDNSFLDGFSLMVSQDTDVQIDMTSAAFDTWLELAELTTPTTLVSSSVNDDLAPGQTNSRVRFTLLAGHQYYVLANSALGDVTGAYTLAISLEPACAAPAAITIGSTVQGVLTTAACRIDSFYFTDRYAVTVQAPTDVTITLNSGDFDTYLTLLRNPAGTPEIVAENDDIVEGVNTNSRIAFTLQPGENYLIDASSFEAFETGAYSLELVLAAPGAGRVAALLPRRSLGAPRETGEKPAARDEGKVLRASRLTSGAGRVLQVVPPR